MSILKIQNLTYHADQTDILNGINLDVEKGDCISIIGASGSGKSTLLKLCADLLASTTGEILYKGKPYATLNPINLRKEISYVVQMPHLFGETVYDNVAFPFEIRKEKVNQDRILQLFRLFNLDESFLTKSVQSLSGGEKQRVALVRNLVYIPEILLLDESTSALDFENASVVERYIEDLNKQGVTVLWITHSINQSESIFNKRVEIEAGLVKKVEVLR